MGGLQRRSSALAREEPDVRRWLFNIAAVVSLLLSVTTAVLWAARMNRPRIGNGCLVFGKRYTLSLLPDRMAILGPPPGAADPAARQRVSQMAKALHAGGGALWYHGTTGGMGFGGFEFGKVLDPYPQLNDRVLDSSTTITGGALDNATIPTLLTALDDDRLFLISHALLTYTEAGSDAADDPFVDYKLKYRLEETASHGHRTGIYDGVPIDLVEDRPERDDGDWGNEIWAVVTTTATPEVRARIRDQWHARLDEPIWTFRYWRVLCFTLIVSAVGFAPHLADRRRRKRRAAGVLCLSCGYNLAGNTSGICPECGTPIQNVQAD
jgi:hypothetical protein